MRVKTEHAEWQRGYDYAAGRLLSGMSTVDELLFHIDRSGAFDRTPFDRGVHSACMQVRVESEAVSELLNFLQATRSPRS